MTINVDAAFTMMEPVGILTVLLAKNYSKILEIVNFKYIFCQSFTNHMSEQHNDSGNRRQNGKTRVSLAFICHAACYIVPTDWILIRRVTLLTFAKKTYLKNLNTTRDIYIRYRIHASHHILKTQKNFMGFFAFMIIF